MAQKPEDDKTRINTAGDMTDKSDSFMTDAVDLIGHIYKFAKVKDIPASEFEKIVTRSYHKTIKNAVIGEIPSLESLVRQAGRKQLPDLDKNFEGFNMLGQMPQLSQPNNPGAESLLQNSFAPQLEMKPGSKFADFKFPTTFDGASGQKQT